VCEIRCRIAPDVLPNVFDRDQRRGGDFDLQAKAAGNAAALSVHLHAANPYV
jgi:hypothetical protein